MAGPGEFRRERIERARRFLAGAPEEKPKPPPIAAKADDLEAIKKAVEDAASVGAPLWLSYLFLLFYIAIAASGVKHADLLLENPVELPFLNIKLPLIAFFVLAPILFVIVHAYVMAHFVLLSEKASRFHVELKRQINGAPDKTHEIREGLRRQLPINVFVQFLAGPAEIREGLFSVLLWAVVWISLVAGPVAVLLLLQAQFLPYHDSRVTWVHRGALIFDLVIIWWLWLKILAGRGKADAGEQTAAGRWAKFWNEFLWWARNVVAWPLTIGIALFAVLVATFPGEWRERPYSLAAPLEPIATHMTQALFGKVDPLNKNENERITGSWPVNTLRLNEFDLYEALEDDDRKKLDLKPHTFILHDRRLEQADLRAARPGKIDLRKAHLEGAWLDHAELQGALLDEAQLQGASLHGVALQGASLRLANLQGASLDKAQLQGTSLFAAHLQGASLEYANLQGASLDKAQLQGASLFAAQLQGVSLEYAYLQGASLNWAQLQGALLYDSRLQGAQLRVSDLTAAQLTLTFLWRADFDFAKPKTLSAEALRWTVSDGEKDYLNMKNMMERDIPVGDLRTAALKRIEILDCEKKDTGLAPCDTNAKPPPIAKEIAKAAVDEKTYAKALAASFGDTICRADENAIYILRGLLKNRRIKAAGPEAAKLAERIQSKDCPVSAALTGDDRAKLRAVVKEATPPPTPAAKK
jgi:uncharacterized protein YjbI with pentapeptide repeats